MFVKFFIPWTIYSTLVMSRLFRPWSRSTLSDRGLVLHFILRGQCTNKRWLTRLMLHLIWIWICILDKMCNVNPRAHLPPWPLFISLRVFLWGRLLHNRDLNVSVPYYMLNAPPFLLFPETSIRYKAVVLCVSGPLVDVRQSVSRAAVSETRRASALLYSVSILLYYATINTTLCANEDLCTYFVRYCAANLIHFKQLTDTFLLVHLIKHCVRCCLTWCFSIKQCLL